MPHPTSRPAPRPTDPIRSSLDALAVISLAIHRPLVHETICFWLDTTSRSRAITIVSGTRQPDDALQVAERMSMAAAGEPEICGLVIASVRPNHLLLPGDADLWISLDSLVDDVGLQLVEWFVVGAGGVELPRDLVGVPERW
jgi:hypothetical protein